MANGLTSDGVITNGSNGCFINNGTSKPAKWCWVKAKQGSTLSGGKWYCFGAFNGFSGSDFGYKAQLYQNTWGMRVE